MPNTCLNIVKPVCFLLSLLSVQMLLGQPHHTDSLLRVINAMKEDTNKVIALKKLGIQLEEKDTATSFNLYQQALSLSRKLNSKEYEARMLINIGNWYSNQDHYDTAKSLYKTALSIGKQFNKPTIVAAAFVNIGNMFNFQNKDDSAIAYFITGAALWERINDPGKLGIIYGNLSMLFTKKHLYQQGLEYGKKALAYSFLAKDTTGIALNYVNVGNAIAKDSIGNDSVKKYRFLALQYSKASGIPSYINTAYHNIADYYYHVKNYPDAILYADTTLLLARKNGTDYILGQDLVEHGLINLLMKKYTEAEKDFREALPIVKRNGYFQPIRETYLDLSEIYKNKKDWQKAYENMQLYAAYKDSAFNEDVADKMQDAEAKYNTEKKEQQIVALQKERELQNLSLQRRMVLSLSLAGGLLALLLIVFLLNKNFQRRKQLAQNEHQLQEQKIKELEQQQQLIATNSLLKGQEEERSRVAKDLHDGLGGMLSGIKLTLHAMKGNVILSADNAYLFSKTVEQLDSSISEMRRVAHNMMPEALVKFGLAQALQDYCDGINETGQINCVLQFYGLENRLDTTTEVVIYRIIQELLNNVMKHAKATEVVVQVIRNEDKINITVEDNGVGFKAGNNHTNKGAGLSNVRSRVSYLRGTMDVESEPGKGTSVHIENLANNSYE